MKDLGNIKAILSLKRSLVEQSTHCSQVVSYMKFDWWNNPINLLTLSLTRSLIGGTIDSLSFEASICLRNSIFFLLASRKMLLSQSTMIVSVSSYPNNQV